MPFKALLLISILLFNGCTTKPTNSVVIPDSHLLKEGIQCKVLDKSDAESLRYIDCTPDIGYVQITKGFMRELLLLLQDCGTKQ